MLDLVDFGLGALYQGAGRCRFRVWAPKAKRVELRLLAPDGRTVELEPTCEGYFEAQVEAVSPGTLYLYRLDGERERPDPCSRHQPQGVHGPSAVVDPSFNWGDAGWFGPALRDYVLYELHVGTFTREGTFEAIIPHIEDLLELGVTAIELLPVGQFPGRRNWGYDGVNLWAPHHDYGGPAGLRRLVDACHRRGMAVVLDVVYNHLGPEGNYLWDFGHYFTDHYKTPWGEAINFDGAYSDEVRRFVIGNALHWLGEYRIDGLRLDALHAIYDFSARHIFAELAETVHDYADRAGRRVQLIAETDLNDSRLIRSPELGGHGLDTQWNDDFHHALHTLLTGERMAYYEPFGRVEHLARAWREGYVYSGQYSSFRRRRHGNRSEDLPASKFVVFNQNHDQIGNRMNGERLSALVGLEELKLAAGVMLLSPYLPMLFMGEEWGEPAPFLYFVSHTDAELVEAVRKGRAAEFKEFAWVGEPPDPQAEETFARSRVDHQLKRRHPHDQLLALHRHLLELRRTHPVLGTRDREAMEVTAFEVERMLAVRRWHGREQTLMLACFGREQTHATLLLPEGNWRKTLDTAEARWGGPGPQGPERIESNGEIEIALPASCLLLYEREA